MGRGSAGPADEVGESANSTRLRDALQQSLSAAVTAANLAPDTQFECIAAAISGYEGRVYGQAPQLPTQNLQLLHDAPAAHAGAFGGAPGVVVIAGTGSVAYGVNARGANVTIGGWGYLFGDEGGGFWYARETIADAMSDLDSHESNELGALALQYFGLPSLRVLARAFYTGEISRARLASFATAVIEAAERGNESAAQYVRTGAAALVRLAMRAMGQLAMPASDVAFTGGLVRNHTLRDEIAQSMRELVPQAKNVEPRYDAAGGALLLAYKAGNLQIVELAGPA